MLMFQSHSYDAAPQIVLRSGLRIALLVVLFVRPVQQYETAWPIPSTNLVQEEHKSRQCQLAILIGKLINSLTIGWNEFLGSPEMPEGP